MNAWNCDKILAATVEGLIKKHQVRTFIETGTHHGHTARWLGERCPHVVTFESEIEHKEYHKDFPANIQVIYGKSQARICEAINQSEQPYAVYLDAHWWTPTPTPLELTQIAVAQYVPEFIIIHDFVVPNTSLGFDRFQDWKNDWPTVKPYADLIFGFDNYNQYYNDDTAEGARRGVLFVEKKL